MNIIKKLGKKGVLAAVAASAMFCVAPQAEAAQTWRQSWYATGAGMGIVNTDDGSPTIDFQTLGVPAHHSYLLLITAVHLLAA